MSNLRVADFIDIMLVAGCLYLLLSWMRQSTSRGTARRLAVVLLLFTVLYLPARVFEMYLIGRVAEVFFVAFILAIIVVFQADLRRMIDRAGTWIFSGSSATSDTFPADQLTEAVAHMAKDQTGALIAIRGSEPWEQHIQGGINLGGTVSPPLLYSLFDHTTPGHDGALLMEGDRIVKFAAHLPLADDVPVVSQYGGTRHSAALGLAERCDAFVIVVSEERGTISVAANGTIEEVVSSNELRERLERFWEKTYGRESGTPRRWIGTHSFQTGVVSLVLAAALWLVFAYSPGTTQRTYEVPIEYRNVPEEWMIEEEARWVDITLSGPEQRFRLIDAGQLAIELDVEDPEEGWNEFTIGLDDLDLPEQLILETVEPQTIQVHARPMRRIELPVAISTEGALPDTLELVSLQVEPDSATVLVPENGVPLTEISTESIDLSEVVADTTFERQLVLTTDMRSPQDGDTEVEVQIEVERVGNSGEEGDGR